MHRRHRDHHRTRRVYPVQRESCRNVDCAVAYRWADSGVEGEPHRSPFLVGQRGVSAHRFQGDDRQDRRERHVRLVCLHDSARLALTLVARQRPC